MSSDTKKVEIYKSIQLLNQVQCDILMANFGDFSRSIYEFNDRSKKDKEPFDMCFFLIKRICLFDGKFKDEKYISELPGECFGQISVFINDLMSTNL